MKSKVISMLVLLVAITGCTKAVKVIPQEDPKQMSLSTKSEVYCDDEFQGVEFKTSDLDTVYFISERDIDSYIKFKELCKDEDKVVSSITPFEYKGALLFYVINYQDGWEIVSADMRTPYLLGKGESGSFSMKDYSSTPWGTWMFTVGLDVLNTRLNGMPVTHEENENVRFWTLLTEPEVILGEPEVRMIRPDIPPGHYELIATYYTHAAQTVTVDHMTTTHWTQTENDCNYYIPYRTDYPTIHAPAGCTAVAGAQMLYYLHYNIGAPVYAPDYAYCVGNYTFPNYDQAGSSSTIWDQMSTYGNQSVAILIAKAAKSINTQFGNSMSSATMSRLVNDFFIPFGISCNYGNYDQGEVRAELMGRNMPVIAGALDQAGNGHAFIIDGYRYTRNETAYVYAYIYDIEPGGPDIILPMPPEEYCVYVYSSNPIEFICMNWGFRQSYGVDDYYFSIGGEWDIELDGEHHNFENNRKMISGFNAN